MAEWVAKVVDQVSGPATAMKGAVLGLGQGLATAGSAIAGIQVSSSKGAAGLRSLYAEADATKAKIARLESTKSTLEKSGSIDIGVGRALSKDLDAARGKLNGITETIAKSGGANFDTKEFDKNTASAAASLGKLAGIAAKVTLAALVSVPSAAIAGLYAVGRKALEGQYQAQARLNAVQARFNLGLRDITKNANLTPFLNALDRGAAMFDKNTATGKLMGEQVKRAFDVAGAAVTALTPYAERAFAKVLLGTIQLETGFLKLLTAGVRTGAGIARWIGASAGRLSAVNTSARILSATFGAVSGAFTALSGALGGGAAWGLAALGMGILAARAGSAAISVARVGAAFVSANPGLAAAALAILAVVAAYKQAIELKNPWDENSADQIKDKFKKTGLFGDDANAVGAVKTDAGKRAEAAAKAALKPANGDAKSAQVNAPPAIATNAVPMASADGKQVGVALGQGVATGIDASKGIIEKSARGAVGAAVTAARTEGEIRSPSGKTRKHVGRELGRGVSIGIEDERGNIERAAQDVLVPDVSTDAGGARGASSRSRADKRASGGNSKKVSFHDCIFNGTQSEHDLETMLIRILHKDELAQSEAVS